MYKITLDGQEFDCSSTQDLLRAAQRKMIKIPYACRGGGCGLCKIKVVRGNYQLGPASKAVLNDQERTEGYSLACKTFPLGEMDVQLFRK